MPEAASPTEALSVDELREQLEMRQRSIAGRLKALEHEFTTLSDVTVAGRPLPDHVRDRPLFYGGLALAGGAVLGFLRGLQVRARLRGAKSEHDAFLRQYVASVVESAAHRVARGEAPDAAVEKTLRRRPPLVVQAPPDQPTRGTLGETWDMAVKTALGFAVKAGMDQLTKRLTGQEEVISAVKEAGEKPMP